MSRRPQILTKFALFALLAVPLSLRAQPPVQPFEIDAEGAAEADEGIDGLEAQIDLSPSYAEPPGVEARGPRCPDCGKWHRLGVRCGNSRGQQKHWLPSSRWLPRHLNHGQPLETSSWLNRPFSLGLFAGTLFGDELVAGQIEQSGDFVGGLRAGWDFDHYWGTEIRFAWSELTATGAFDSPLSATGDVFLADLVFIHYPWGDSRIRPYALLGIGTSSFDYTTSAGTGIDESLLTMPIGGGIKYLLKPWLAMRFELADHIAFGRGQASTMHNVAISLGLEWRLGGSRRSYYPWHPSRVIR